MTPDVLLLEFIRQAVMLAEDEGGHQAPFRDWWAVDAGGCGDGDLGVSDDRVPEQAVHACHGRVYELEAGDSQYA